MITLLAAFNSLCYFSETIAKGFICTGSRAYNTRNGIPNNTIDQSEMSNARKVSPPRCYESVELVLSNATFAVTFPANSSPFTGSWNINWRSSS